MIVSGGQALDFAPQALGETVPQIANGYYYGASGLALSNKFATYGALYRAQPAIATLVDKIANSAARLTFRVWDDTPANGKIEDGTSAFARLMARPNGFQPSYTFWRWTVSTYEVYGEAFWLKVRDDAGSVVALLPMHPSRTSVKRNADTGRNQFIFSLGVASAGMLTVDEADVVPFLRYNPDNLERGLSRLEPLRSTLLNEDAARRATASWWQNGARPSVLLKHPGTLSPKAAERISASWASSQGGADNMAKAAVLEEGMDAQVVQLSAEEMQYVESRKFNLQEACMVYDVPPPVVHILDHATFSNITEQMRSMYRDTMTPRLEEIESIVDFHVRSEFYPEASHYGAFSLDEVLRGDFETRAAAVKELIQSGVMTPAEGRPLFDLPKAGPEADLLYGNAALVPLGSSVRGALEVDTQGNLIPTPLPGTTAGTDGTGQDLPPTTPVPEKRYDVRSLMGRVGSVKAYGGDVRAALVEEHTKALEGFYGRQGDALVTNMSAEGIDKWDPELAGLLASLGVATAKALGDKVAKHLGGNFDDTGVAGWVHDDATTSARFMNEKTGANFTDAVKGSDNAAEAAAAFAAALMSKAAQVARTRVAVVGGLAEQSAAEQSGAGSKTWVTGPNPREDHAAMDGETVPLGEVFSNGMNGPGDPAGGVDEVAGCNCSLVFEMP